MILVCEAEQDRGSATRDGLLGSPSGRPPGGGHSVWTCRLSPVHPWGHVAGCLPALPRRLVLLTGRPELPRGRV